MTKHMKRVSMLLAVLMVVTCCTVFASARREHNEGHMVGEGPALAHFSMVPTNGSTEVTYLGTATDDVPDDIFGVALNINTDNVPFCRFKVELNFDTTKLEYVACSANGSDAGDIMEQYDPVHQLNYDICNDDVFIDQGDIIVTMTAPDNLTYKAGFKKKELYEGTMIYLYFHPITAERCDTTIRYTYTECVNEIPAQVTSDSTGITLKLNGGAPVEGSEPVISIGSKVHTDKVALRFGAAYTRMKEKGAVDELGMLLLPKEFLKNEDGTYNELDLDCKDLRVKKPQANGIVEFVSGQKFEDYAKFTFYCTVINLGPIPAEGKEDIGHTTDVIVARPYIKYESGEVVYADAMPRSYKGVADVVLPVA